MPSCTTMNELVRTSIYSKYQIVLSLDGQTNNMMNCDFWRTSFPMVDCKTMTVSR